ncbi:MAG: hypothetical protein INR65_11145, partial [Gluconacetobacter diazotrophicus]|nr:hypothetical protein [Gluconacetobacter diazotrophicus]
MRRVRAARVAALLAMAAMGNGTAAAADRCALPSGSAPASVYLIQDSGWMEPFYDDPRSPFRPLLDALV